MVYIRKRNRKKRLNQQIYSRLTDKFNSGKGRSRHADKRAGVDARYIYSDNTYHTYMQQCKRFAAWMRRNFPTCGDLDDCRAYVPAYLRSLIAADVSAWTISTAAAALGKLYGCDYREFGVELPQRRRENIKRSREPAVRDAHVSSELREEFHEFCKCCGLRRSELQALRGGDLMRQGGRYFIRVRRGKGGKERLVPLVGTEREIAAVLRRFQLCKEGAKVFLFVPSALDVHAFRAEYANRLYKLLERVPEEVPRADLYICRGGDFAGVRLDKRALKVVSQALGHNRLDVVVSHYLRS